MTLQDKIEKLIGEDKPSDIIAYTQFKIKFRQAIPEIIKVVREDEKERQYDLMMKCLPKDAENLSLLTPDQAKRLIDCFIKQNPWTTNK